MPTPNLFVDSEIDPFAKVACGFQSNEVEVFYVTDRVPETQSDGTIQYGYERSHSVAFGSCIVRLGRDVDWGTLVANSRVRRRDVSLGLSIQRITEEGRFPETPFPLIEDGGTFRVDPIAEARAVEVSTAGMEGIERRLALTPRKEVYIFIHGFNNTFDDAIFTIAELWHFLGREGVPVAYTWPAGRGGLRGYAYDRESGEFTIFHLKQLLQFLADCPSLEKVHILAHSRGTDVAATAIRELIIEARAAGWDARAKYKIANLILVAPDMDLDVTRQRFASERFFQFVDRMTLYVSQSDRAIGLSGWLFGSLRRIGRFGTEDLTDEMRVSLEASQTYIVNAEVSAGFIGHGYFHSSPAVSSDLILMLRDNLGPEDPGRPLIKRDVRFFEINDRYPTLADD